MAATHRLFDRRYTNAFATWPTRLCLLLHEPSPRARTDYCLPTNVRNYVENRGVENEEYSPRAERRSA